MKTIPGFMRHIQRPYLTLNAFFLIGLLFTSSAFAQYAVKEKTVEIDATKIKDSLVQITDDGIIGIGFIATLDGKQYILTTASVVSGHDRMTFTTLSGKTLRPSAIELSATRDLARFRVAGEQALKVAADTKPDQPAFVLEYHKEGGAIADHGGKIEKTGKDMIDLTVEFEDVCCGSPLLNKNLEVVGVVDHISYYKPDNKSWVGQARRFAYRLDDAGWYAPNWKQYNATYGRYLQDADQFRKRIYGLTNQWIEDPKKLITLTDDMSMDVSRWVKKHNDMAGDLRNTSGDAANLNYMVGNKFQDNCKELIKISTGKASQLDFLCSSNKDITPYLRIQFTWRALELNTYATFLKAYGERMEDYRWR